jgi:hypothetical protein
MPDNMALYIDDETQDLTFDDRGELTRIYGNDTTAQCVRLTLTAYKGDFFLDTTHGTEWTRILGRKQSELSEDEAEEVLRDAILQEREVAYVDGIGLTRGARSMDAEFDCALRDGSTVHLGVARGV